MKALRRILITADDFKMLKYAVVASTIVMLLAIAIRP